jgi:hypothetical protein
MRVALAFTDPATIQRLQNTDGIAIHSPNFSKDIPMMKRFVVTSLFLGASTIGLAGCDEKTKVEETKTVKTPGGSDTTKTTVEEKKTGDAKTDAAK